MLKDALPFGGAQKTTVDWLVGWLVGGGGCFSIAVDDGFSKSHSQEPPFGWCGADKPVVNNGISTTVPSTGEPSDRISERTIHLW